MYLEPYSLDELRFAYCCHVYFRWHTHWRRRHPALAHITAASIQQRRPDIHILNLKSSQNELAVLASLRPTHSVSIASSKLKGAVSKIVRQADKVPLEDKVVGDGYFACTSGPSTLQELHAYLENQSQHHGYDERPQPPTYVRSWKVDHFEKELQGKRSVTSICWHLAFSTWAQRDFLARGGGSSHPVLGVVLSSK